MSDMWALYDALTQPSGWRAQAACLGMDTDDWFPEQGGDCRPSTPAPPGSGDVECSLPGHGDLGSWLVAEGHGQEVDG